jgi:acylphosphatase
MSDPVRAHVLITGRVQGVGYRYSTVGEAERRRLAGWVRNLPNGGVEAVFEGAKADVEQMIEWCRQGPPSARVTNVDVRWEAPKGEKNFRITS